MTSPSGPTGYCKELSSHVLVGLFSTISVHARPNANVVKVVVLETEVVGLVVVADVVVGVQKSKYPGQHRLLWLASDELHALSSQTQLFSESRGSVKISD